MTGIEALGQSGFTQSKAAAKSKELGKDEFLTMFVAQLKNQDPLNPMQGQEFAAQLAQFSSLEQLYNVNENLQTLKSSGDDASRLQALDFIGKDIVAKGDSLQLLQGQVSNGSFELSRQADCVVAIRNGDGATVRTLPLGMLNAGGHSFQWDGHDGAGNLLSSGTYQFSISARTPSGEMVSGDARVTGKVTGVNLENGSVRLYIGNVPVPVSDVMEITAPAAAASSDNS